MRQNEVGTHICTVTRACPGSWLLTSCHEYWDMAGWRVAGRGLDSGMECLDQGSGWMQSWLWS